MPTEELDDFDEKFIESMRKVATNGIDLARMKMTLEREKRGVRVDFGQISLKIHYTQIYSSLESRGGDMYSNAAISDYLYEPEDGSGLSSYMDDIPQFDELLTWTNEQWVELINKYVARLF